MDENRKKAVTAILKYSIATGVAAGIAVAIMSARGVFDGSLPLDQVYRYLSDAFFIPGAILVLFGALVFISTTGFFDSISYIGMVAIRALIPGMRMNKGERYVDYKERKSEGRISGYSFIFFVGLAFLAVGIIFTALFYTA